MRRAIRSIAALCCLVFCGSHGGVTAKESANTKYPSVRIDSVPHVRQKPDFCGEACVAMMLRKLGVEADQDWVHDQAKLDPGLGRGCYTKELAEALQRSGFDIGTVWHQIPAKVDSPALNDQFATLHRDLKNGQPSIICMRYKEGPRGSEHFRLILGYDSQTDEILYHEPAEDDGAYRRMSRSQLLSLWPLKYADDQWTIIRMTLKLTKPPMVRKSDNLTDADLPLSVTRTLRPWACGGRCRRRVGTA